METLDYRSPATDQPRHRSGPLPFRILCWALMPVVLWTCLRIELLNRQAGHVLPRSEPGKWRVPFVQDEGSWRRLESRTTGDPTLATRPLTPTETARMKAEVRTSVANGQLRDAVSTVGLLQYLLTPALLAASHQLYRRRRPRSDALIAAAAALTAASCAAAMLYRAYLPSLGW